MSADNELNLFIDNDGAMYREYTRPLHQRLALAKANGTFDRLRALKAFDAIINEGVRRYKREWPDSSFSVADKKDAASEMLRYFEVEYKLGNIKPDAKVKAEVDALLKRRR